MEEPQLLQARYRADPWRVLICCALLNRTSRRRVDPVVEPLFAEYPDAERMAHARVSEVRALIKPLSASMVKARELVELSDSWVTIGSLSSSSLLPTIKEVSVLPGVGKYATDSYSLFVLNNMAIHPNDRELKRWLRWWKSVNGEQYRRGE